MSADSVNRRRSHDFGWRVSIPPNWLSTLLQTYSTKVLKNNIFSCLLKVALRFENLYPVSARQDLRLAGDRPKHKRTSAYAFVEHCLTCRALLRFAGEVGGATPHRHIVLGFDHINHFWDTHIFR